MIQNSQSKNMTFYFDDYQQTIIISYLKWLLTRHHTKNKKGYYFQKNNLAPTSIIYLRTYLRNYHPFYEQSDKLEENYQTLVKSINRLTISQLYNFILFLKETHTATIAYYQAFKMLDILKNKSNDLQNISTTCNPLKFIGEL